MRKHNGCREDSCPGEHFAKGLCHKHYKQSRRVAAQQARPAAQRPSCTVEGCSGFNYGNGMCRSHYYKNQRAEHRAANPLQPRPVSACTREGCDQPASGGYGMCGPHYYQHYRKPHLTMTAAELAERYPSTTWNAKTWELALTVRGDVLDHILDDMHRLAFS
jgi:hypothetical protein